MKGENGCGKCVAMKYTELKARGGGEWAPALMIHTGNFFRVKSRSIKFRLAFYPGTFGPGSTFGRRKVLPGPIVTKKATLIRNHEKFGVCTFVDISCRPRQNTLGKFSLEFFCSKSSTEVNLKKFRRYEGGGAMVKNVWIWKKINEMDEKL